MRQVAQHSCARNLDGLNIDHAYLGFVAATTTFVRVCPCVGDGHQSAQVTNVHLVGIRCLEQTLPQELSCSVSNLTVTLHLAKPQTTITEDGRTRSDINLFLLSTGRLMPGADMRSHGQVRYSP